MVFVDDDYKIDVRDLLKYKQEKCLFSAGQVLESFLHDSLNSGGVVPPEFEFLLGTDL